MLGFPIIRLSLKETEAHTVAGGCWVAELGCWVQDLGLLIQDLDSGFQDFRIFQHMFGPWWCSCPSLILLY